MSLLSLLSLLHPKCVDRHPSVPGAKDRVREEAHPSRGEQCGFLFFFPYRCFIPYARGKVLFLRVMGRKCVGSLVGTHEVHAGYVGGGERLARGPFEPRFFDRHWRDGRCSSPSMVYNYILGCGGGLAQLVASSPSCLIYINPADLRPVWMRLMEPDQGLWSRNHDIAIPSHHMGPRSCSTHAYGRDDSHGCE